MAKRKRRLSGPGSPQIGPVVGDARDSGGWRSSKSKASARSCDGSWPRTFTPPHAVRPMRLHGTGGAMRMPAVYSMPAVCQRQCVRRGGHAGPESIWVLPRRAEVKLESTRDEVLHLSERSNTIQIVLYWSRPRASVGESAPRRGVLNLCPRPRYSFFPGASGI